MSSSDSKVVESYNVAYAAMYTGSDKSARTATASTVSNSNSTEVNEIKKDSDDCLKIIGFSCLCSCLNALF